MNLQKVDRHMMAQCCNPGLVTTQYLNANALVRVVTWIGRGAALIGIGGPLCLYKLGLRLRLRDRQAILPEALKMHGDRGTNILL